MHIVSKIAKLLKVVKQDKSEVLIYFPNTKTLIAPNLVKNLIYVRKLTRDNNCPIRFLCEGPSYLHFDSSAQWFRRYISSHLPAPYQSTFFYPHSLITHAALSISLWHHHLGHPSDHVLNTLVARNFITCFKHQAEPICNSCQLGKNSRLSFSISLSKSKFLLNLFLWIYGCLSYLVLLVSNIISSL